LIDRIIYFVIGLIKPLLIWYGKLHWPGSKRKMTEAKVKECIAMAQVGDVIITRKNWEPTNLLIKGEFKHATLVIDKEVLAEAVAPVSKKTGYYDLLMKSDRAKLCRANNFTGQQLDLSSVYALNHLGRAYDYYFDDGNENNYCSEFCYEALKYAKNSWDFVRKKVLGKYTIAPDDFRLAKKHFDIVWGSDDN